MPAKSRFISAMAGLAMLALPVSAFASDHHHHWDQSAFARSASPAMQMRNNVWQHGGFGGNNPRFAFSHPGAGWNGYSNHRGNWWRNTNSDWNRPPVFGYRTAVPPPAYGYVPPPNAYAYVPPPSRSYFAVPPSYYGMSGYPNSYGYGNGYGYGGENPMTLRDRLLQERAGAYQQLAIRERNGDRNGAHHLWNTINSLNRQLGSVR